MTRTVVFLSGATKKQAIVPASMDTQGCTAITVASSAVDCQLSGALDVRAGFRATGLLTDPR
jgi:hypothetical protein